MTMKKWGWLLLGLVVIVVFFTREGFQNTDKIKGPPYDDSDYAKIVAMMDPAWVSSLGDAETPDGKRTIAEKVTPIMGQFHADVYQPAKDSLKQSDVDDFLIKNPSLFEESSKRFVKSFLITYFIDQPHGIENAPMTGDQIASANYAQSSGYNDILASLGQGPSGTSSLSSTPGPASPTGPTGGAGGAGGATGGSGGGASGPPSGGVKKSKSGNGQKVWGPKFTGFGDNKWGDDRDTRPYPTLLGPTPKPSTMVEGAGIVRQPKDGSGSGSGSGNTPSSASLGSDPNSQYLPYSRAPGDNDLIPDPYRVASNFSASNGSMKMEPVPFLTDFSAFMK
jgi:hypothetical protein